jgi:hypothetical protein
MKLRAVYASAVVVGSGRVGLIAAITEEMIADPPVLTAYCLRELAYNSGLEVDAESLEIDIHPQRPPTRNARA